MADRQRQERRKAFIVASQATCGDASAPACQSKARFPLYTPEPIQTGFLNLPVSDMSGPSTRVRTDMTGTPADSFLQERIGVQLLSTRTTRGSGYNGSTGAAT